MDTVQNMDVDTKLFPPSDTFWIVALNNDDQAIDDAMQENLHGNKFMILEEYNLLRDELRSLNVSCKQVHEKPTRFPPLIVT